jgi:hypothetical protein
MMAVCVIALPDPWLAQHADVSAVPNLIFYRGQRAQISRPIADIEYDGDWTIVVFEGTDELPEMRAAFLWWDMPFVFEDDVNSNPHLQFTARIAGTLSGRDGRWIINSPMLVRWK